MIATLLATLALAVPLPNPLPPITFTDAPCGDPLIRGCYLYQKPPIRQHIYLRRGLPQRSQRYVLRHELGHAFDYTEVTAAERRRYRFPKRGSERFATKYAGCTLARKRARICLRIRRAGRT